MFDLSGRRILVTGAARGLGLDIAETCRRAGADVALCDVDADGLAAAVERLAAIDASGAVDAQVMDVADEEAVTAALDTIGAPLWGLVNNAALADAVGGKNFWELDAAEWDRLMAVNLRGPWLVAKHAVAHLRAGHGGRIVNMASDAALYGSPRLSHYIASKGGVISLTRAMARELGPEGITVNAVAPGIVETESTRNVPAQRHQLYAETRALTRPQQPADVSGAVAFLLSDAASYLTGQTLVVDGGFVMP